MTITADTQHCRAVLEFNLGPDHYRRPLYTAKYRTLSELLDVIRAFTNEIGTKITSIKVQRLIGNGQWTEIPHSAWADLLPS